MMKRMRWEYRGSSSTFAPGDYIDQTGLLLRFWYGRSWLYCLDRQYDGGAEIAVKNGIVYDISSSAWRWA